MKSACFFQHPLHLIKFLMTNDVLQILNTNWSLECFFLVEQLIKIVLIYMSFSNWLVDILYKGYEFVICYDTYTLSIYIYLYLRTYYLSIYLPSIIMIYHLSLYLQLYVFSNLLSFTLSLVSFNASSYDFFNIIN